MHDEYYGPVHPPVASRRGKGGRVLLVLAVVLCLAGGGLTVAALTGVSPPVGASPAIPDTSVSPTGGSSPKLPRRTPARGPITPAYVDIPAIGVKARTTPVKLDKRRELQVPPPAKVGWWRQGAKPGAQGVAVLVGHVDSATGPAVFYDLSQLQPGAKVRVSAADGQTVTYRVDRVRRYAKDAFPTKQVYGATKGAQLRLITCGGEYDRADGGYRDNIVVFASLIPS